MNQQQNLKPPSAKLCTIEGHQKVFTTHICIYDKCEFNNRWICIKCVLQKKHSHSLQNDNHILDQEMFYMFLKDEQEKSLKQIKEMSNQILSFKKKLRVLVDEINFIFQQLEIELISQSKNYTLILIDQMIKMTEEDFSKISNEQIMGLRNKNTDCNLSFYQELKSNMNKINQTLNNIIMDIDQNHYGNKLLNDNCPKAALVKPIKASDKEKGKQDLLNLFTNCHGKYKNKNDLSQFK